jgi:hypothetical protein
MRPTRPASAITTKCAWSSTKQNKKISGPRESLPESRALRGNPGEERVPLLRGEGEVPDHDGSLGAGRA